MVLSVLDIDMVCGSLWSSHGGIVESSGLSLCLLLNKLPNMLGNHKEI